MRHCASRRAIRLTGTRLKRTLPFALLAFVLVLAACSGVNDNGTQAQALETAAARQTEAAQPPPPPPTPAPGETPAPGSPDPALVEAGRQLATSKGCVGCHSIDGSPGVGPSWKGLWGHNVELTGGTTVVADEAYIRESILDPGAKVVNGFQNIMPSFQGQLTDDEINALIAYIQSLQ